MRSAFTMLTAAVVLCGMALTVRAEDADQGKSPGETKKTDAKAEWIAFAKLQIKMHRTLADLIEAQIAPQPDKAKIKELTKKLEQLRSELRDQRPPRFGGWGMGPGFGCPWGGPGMGYGLGQGGGRGRGMGPGFGCPWGGPGMGYGLGQGRGRGRGMGPGRGGGPRPGFGPGRRYGPGRGLTLPPGPPPWGPDPEEGED